MKALSSAERRALRARAHALHPVVIVGSVGSEGPAAAVLAEIERSLAAHELIKVRVAEASRPEREALLEDLCERTGSAPVQHIGKILVIYRPRPREPAEPPARPRGGRADRKAGVRGPERSGTGAAQGAAPKRRRSPARQGARRR